MSINNLFLENSNYQNNSENLYKKRKISIDKELNFIKIPQINTFILNSNNINEYKNINPDELIIIYSSENYSKKFLQSIIDGGIKNNIKKIITSDSVIIKYLDKIGDKFLNLFPNCQILRINSLANDFVLISRIINNLKIVNNIEYILNDCVFFNNSVLKYKHFFYLFFSCDLSNLKYIKIINNIKNLSDCEVEKNIILNIVNIKKIEKKNNIQNYIISKYNTKKENIHNINLEYVDIKRNISINEKIINIKETNFVDFI